MLRARAPVSLAGHAAQSVCKIRIELRLRPSVPSESLWVHSTGTGTPKRHRHRHFTGTDTPKAQALQRHMLQALHRHRHSTGTDTPPAQALKRHRYSKGTGHRHSTGTDTLKAHRQWGALLRSHTKTECASLKRGLLQQVWSVVFGRCVRIPCTECMIIAMRGDSESI